MLCRLFIQNLAIIDEITIDFQKDLTVITGETGAGKSILVGSLQLLMGSKFDSAMVKNKDKKCMVEAIFQTDRKSILDILQTNEIENNNEIILRREILPSGTSRCYINDMVVPLSMLKELCAELIDIHSQHQNLLLAQRDFQLYIVDALAQQLQEVTVYKQAYTTFREKQAQWQKLLSQQQQQQQQIDFLTFQQKELETVRYTLDEFNNLEQESITLQHAEEIIQKLSDTNQLLNESEHAVIAQLKNVSKLLQSLAGQLKKSEDWCKRLDNVYFELKDVHHDIETELNSIQINPASLEKIQSDLDTVYRLYQKHHVHTYIELLEIKQQITSQLNAIHTNDETLKELEKELGKELKILQHKADILHQKRLTAIRQLKQKIIPLLQSLGIPNAAFDVSIETLLELTETGIDKLTFLFSANTKIAPMPVQKIASGGELSRVMLALKTIIANVTFTETIFLDEIDAGISGEIAYKMGVLIQQLAQNIQVIAITHLPQIAACGKYHKLVQKTQNNKTTFTNVIDLTENERITEIAKMLSATEITTSALEQATHLLEQAKSGN